MSTFIHCLHFSQHFGLFLSSHQNGPLFSVCTIPARMKKGTVPCFLFQLLVSRIELISAGKKQQQNHEAVGLRIQEAERAESLQPVSLFLLTQSTTAPSGMLLPTPCMGLHTHLTQIQSLPHSYAQRFINILIMDLSKRERYPPHMQGIDVGQKRNRLQKISHFFNLKNVEFHKCWSFPDTRGQE